MFLPLRKGWFFIAKKVIKFSKKVWTNIKLCVKIGLQSSRRNFIMLLYSKRLGELLYVCDAFVEQCTTEYNSWRRKNSCALKEYILWQAEQGKLRQQVGE